MPLPAGSDPAELVQREGAEAMQAAVAEAVPFVRFRVERVLASGDRRTAEGRDRMLAELRPVFAELPPSAMRMELTQIVSSRFALRGENLAEQLLAAGRSAGRCAAGRRGGRHARERRDAAGAPPGSGEPSRREETERAFLALCIASPPRRASGAGGARRRRALLERAAAPRRAAPARRRPGRADGASAPARMPPTRTPS